MAQVTTEVSTRVERLLDYLTEAWQGLPAAEREIDGWDLIEQIDYVEEWNPTEELRIQLNRYADGDMLSAEQRCRYDELQGLVVRHQPILKRLRAS